MSRFGFIGPSYTARSSAVAAEECINLYSELTESQGSIVSTKAYGGANAASVRSYFWAPGVSISCTFPVGPVRGQCWTGSQLYAVAGNQLFFVSSAGVATSLATVINDGNPVAIAFNSLQLLIVSGGRAYCYTIASNTLLDVTQQLAAVPAIVAGSDTYFIVSFVNSNKFQMSQVLDGTTWPGQLVNEVSVFPENISSIKTNHRELWVFGLLHTQPYQDTGSTEVFDVIQGTLIENGNAPTFGPERADNSLFWIGQDERGGRMAWRSNGYSPQRISTHAVEYDLSKYTAAQIASLVSYSYQDGGHIFWVLYIPGSTFSWVFDITEGMWHKRAKWVKSAYAAHWGWNHTYAYGQHLIGDWNSGNLYLLSPANLTDNGTTIRRLRRAPTIGDEMKWVYHSKLVVDFETGLGPQPPLLDGSGKPRPPQAMLRWSDDRGKTWSNYHVANCGLAGQTKARAVWFRLGRSRYRIYEVTLTDPIAWTIVDAYLDSETADQ